jgi:hypothetical protein
MRSDVPPGGVASHVKTQLEITIFAVPPALDRCSENVSSAKSCVASIKAIAILPALPDIAAAHCVVNVDPIRGISRERLHASIFIIARVILGSTGNAASQDRPFAARTDHGAIAVMLTQPERNAAPQRQPYVHEYAISP